MWAHIKAAWPANLVMSLHISWVRLHEGMFMLFTNAFFSPLDVLGMGRCMRRPEYDWSSALSELTNLWGEEG